MPKTEKVFLVVFTKQILVTKRSKEYKTIESYRKFGDLSSKENEKLAREFYLEILKDSEVDSAELCEVIKSSE